MRDELERIIHMEKLVARLRRNGTGADIAYLPSCWEVTVRYGKDCPLSPGVYWGTDGSGEVVRVAVSS
jgi:hypothetical protein